VPERNDAEFVSPACVIPECEDVEVTRPCPEGWELEWERELQWWDPCAQSLDPEPPCPDEGSVLLRPDAPDPVVPHDAELGPDDRPPAEPEPVTPDWEGPELVFPSLSVTD
jgi:hypothetical protein